MKLNLQTDQKILRAYIEERVRNYGTEVNDGPGDPQSPISLVTFGFYAEQGGYVNLVFDTRQDSETDGHWIISLTTRTRRIFLNGSRPAERLMTGKSFRSSGMTARHATFKSQTELKRSKVSSET